MEGMTYLAIGYFGMLVGIALWTYTVVQRSRRLDERMAALEGVINAPESENGHQETQP
jgi:hypothetical protein